MIELLRTTDPVRLSFLRDALGGAGVEAMVFDGGGPWPGAFPGRLMVADEDAEIARRVIETAEASAGSSLASERLILRQWRDEDRAPFAAMRADPVFMKHWPTTWSAEESNAWIDREAARIDDRGLGFWALERQEDGRFVGYAGLRPAPSGPCEGEIEIGWGLRRDAWGQGYATEAARRALAFGFEDCGFPEIVAFTAGPNEPSQAVMRRLGMTREPGRDFEFASIPEGSPLRNAIVYVARPGDHS